MERNRHVDEGTVHAWLDGALGAEESARVEAHVAECAACGAKTAEARGLIAAASRILTALDDVPAGVVPRARPEPRRRFLTGWPLRAAAVIVFVAVGSFAVVQRLDVTRVERSEAPAAAPAAVRLPALQAAPAAPPPSHPAAKALVKKFAPVHKENAPAREGATQGAVGGVDKGVDSAVTISGRVVSAKTGEPVPSAVVALTNPQVTAATNAAGAYALPVPAGQAAGQQSALIVRRLGYAPKTDSITVARDAAPHDVQLAPSNVVLSQVTVAGARATQAVPPPTCYVTTTPGLPARIQLGDNTVSWARQGPDSIRIVVTDSTGAEQHIVARMNPTGLTGVVTTGDSGSVRQFVATRCP